MMEIVLLVQFLLDLSNKGVIESYSHHIRFISRKKELIKCPTATTTPGKPCKTLKPEAPQTHTHTLGLVNECASKQSPTRWEGHGELTFARKAVSIDRCPPSGGQHKDC